MVFTPEATRNIEKSQDSWPNPVDLKAAQPTEENGENLNHNHSHVSEKLTRGIPPVSVTPEPGPNDLTPFIREEFNDSPDIKFFTAATMEYSRNIRTRINSFFKSLFETTTILTHAIEPLATYLFVFVLFLFELMILLTETTDR